MAEEPEREIAIPASPSATEITEAAGFDLSLIRESLALSYEQRAIQHQAALDLALEMERAGKRLRETPTFIGDVDVLRGGFGADGRREGEVWLTLYRGEEVVKATAYLTAEQYECALRAHVDGRRVVIRGVLSRDAPLQELEGIVSFGLL